MLPPTIWKVIRQLRCAPTVEMRSRRSRNASFVPRSTVRVAAGGSASFQASLKKNSLSYAASSAMRSSWSWWSTKSSMLRKRCLPKWSNLRRLSSRSLSKRPNRYWSSLRNSTRARLPSRSRKTCCRRHCRKSRRSWRRSKMRSNKLSEKKHKKWDNNKKDWPNKPEQRSCRNFKREESKNRKESRGRLRRLDRPKGN